MVSLSSYRGGGLLKAADLGRKEHLVQIESISEEDVGEERKLVMRFEGKTKGLVLNDTNLETIEAAFGDDSDAAVGAQMILFVDGDVRYAGKKAAKEKAAPKESTAEYLNDALPDW